MRLKSEREQVAAFGRRLQEAGLVTGTFGNVSVFDPKSGLMAISPSGLPYDAVGAAEVAVVDLDGRRVEGARKPSSEVDLHRIFYRHRPEIAGIIHTHSVYATTLACLQAPIPPIHYLVGYAGRQVPCTAYYPFGTQALADAAFAAMGPGKACLLGNHGLLALGEDIAEAFDVAEQIEYVARLYVQLKPLGAPALLTEAQIDAATAALAGYHRP
jgi:L-fuculose-phosphate aldolase